MTAASGMPGWKVVNLTPRTEFVGGGPQAGFDVAFQTDSGIAATVFVSSAQLGDPERVRAIIAERVGQLDGIHQLSG